MRNGRNRKLRNRIILISVLSVLAVVLVIGLWMYSQYKNDKKTVEVVSVSQIADTYFGDQGMSSGIISSDDIQELYPTDQIISEVFVSEGQQVSIGDPLLQYDRTQFELDLEKKEIAVLQADLNLTTAQKQLRKLQNTKPYTTPKPTPTPKPGTTPRPGTSPTPKPSTGPTPVPPADVPVYGILNLDSRPYSGSGTSEDPYHFLCTSDCAMTPEFLKCLLGVEAAPTPVPGEETDEDDKPLISPFAAVFEVRKEDSNYGELISSFKLDGSDLSASFQFSNILNSYNTLDSVATIFEVPATPSPDNYNDMNYTSAQLKELISEKQQEIRNLQHTRKQAELDRDVAKRQLDNSTVLSTVDGTVRSLVDLDTARANGGPIMVVSGDSVYYVSGAISESLLGVVQIGDQVTVNDYMYGGSYTAEIVSISDYPLDSDSNLYYYGSGNPNSSSYEFTAVIKDADNLQTGSYVDITLSIQEDISTDALHIQNPYIREDEGGSYVMKAGLDNRLVKQYVQTGRSLYGYATEIKSGLTINDYVAFPYGPDVAEGVRVVVEGSGDEPQHSDENIPVLDDTVDGGPVLSVPEVNPEQSGSELDADPENNSSYPTFHDEEDGEGSGSSYADTESGVAVG